jgi:hypothetical protein
MAKTKKPSPEQRVNNVFRKDALKTLTLRQLATRPNSLEILMKPSRMGSNLIYPKL